MPIVLWALRGLSVLFSALVPRILISLGIGIATFAGVKTLVDQAKALIVTQLGGLSGDVINVLALCKVDVAINILFSALIVRLTLQGMSAAGAITRFKVGS